MTDVEREREWLCVHVNGENLFVDEDSNLMVTLNQRGKRGTFYPKGQKQRPHWQQQLELKVKYRFNIPFYYVLVAYCTIPDVIPVYGDVVVTVGSGVLVWVAEGVQDLVLDDARPQTPSPQTNPHLQATQSVAKGTVISTDVSTHTNVTQTVM